MSRCRSRSARSPELVRMATASLGSKRSQASNSPDRQVEMQVVEIRGDRTVDLLGPGGEEEGLGGCDASKWAQGGTRVRFFRNTKGSPKRSPMFFNQQLCLFMNSCNVCLRTALAVRPHVVRGRTSRPDLSLSAPARAEPGDGRVRLGEEFCWTGPGCLGVCSYTARSVGYTLRL